jgi:hypothetical protein
MECLTRQKKGCSENFWRNLSKKKNFEDNEDHRDSHSRPALARQRRA